MGWLVGEEGEEAQKQQKKESKMYYQSVRGINEELMCQVKELEIGMCFFATNFIYAPPPLHRVDG